MPSNGVCVLMNRRCCCASSSAVTSSSGASCMSSQGETFDIGAGSSGPSKTSNATSRCIHVVPHFGGVLMTMSPSRKRNPSHRALSATTDRWRARWTIGLPLPAECVAPAGRRPASARGYLLGHDACVFLGHDVVAVARDPLQSGPVDDGEGAAAVADQSLLLQSGGDFGDGGTANAEHLGHELLLEGKILTVDSVVAHEQPPRGALLGVVQAIARDVLGELHDGGLRVEMQQPVQGPVVGEEPADVGDAADQGLPVDLAEPAVRAGRGAEECGQSGHTFAADGGHLDGGGVL